MVDLRMYTTARSLAQRAIARFAEQHGGASLPGVGTKMAEAFLAIVLDEMTRGRLAVVVAPTTLAIPKVKVLGGMFDGQDTAPEAVHKVVLTPPNGTMAHYELVYLHRGTVTEEQAERIVGRKLDG